MYKNLYEIRLCDLISVSLAFNGFDGVVRRGKDERGEADHRSQIPDDSVGNFSMDGKVGAAFL